ncbi:hypothetical protein RSAG8_09330, partial [Rhizoctonia solani AG-8 WAC10335]
MYTPVSEKLIPKPEATWPGARFQGGIAGLIDFDSRRSLRNSKIFKLVDRLRFWRPRSKIRRGTFCRGDDLGANGLDLMNLILVDQIPLFFCCS